MSPNIYEHHQISVFIYPMILTCMIFWLVRYYWLFNCYQYIVSTNIVVGIDMDEWYWLIVLAYTITMIFMSVNSETTQKCWFGVCSKVFNAQSGHDLLLLSKHEFIVNLRKGHPTVSHHDHRRFFHEATALAATLYVWKTSQTCCFEKHIASYEFLWFIDFINMKSAVSIYFHIYILYIYILLYNIYTYFLYSFCDFLP